MTLGDIGEDDNALLCITNQTTSCQTSDTGDIVAVAPTGIGGGGGGGGGGQQGQFAPGPQFEGGPNDAELFQIRSSSFILIPV